jgi:YbgC/YbaW family acyl-CoA thioester hydrolase
MESADPGHKANGYFRVTMRVPLKDVDPFQVVWYGNYIGYFDLARTALLRRYGLGPPDLAAWGFYAPVVGAEVQYHAPARYDDEIVVAVRPETHRTPRSHFTFGCSGKRTTASWSAARRLTF